MPVNYLNQIQRGIDFIETYLEEDIPLATVAREAGLSQWHYQRIFKALTKETLKNYIRARRLANALDKLLETRMGILNIAILAGYNSQEAFTRAFKEHYALTPNEFRQRGRRNLIVRKLKIDESYLRHIHHNMEHIPELDTRPAMLLVGMHTRFYGSDSDKNNLGEQLPPLWERFIARLAEVEHTVPGCCYGVVLPAAGDSDELEYYAAIEVRQIDALPAGMHKIEIPATNYATFLHRGVGKLVDQTVDFIYSSWLCQSEYRHNGGPDLEIYDASFDPLSENSQMRYAIPIA
ncbi:AraC family transcriptional regulator [Undibacterium terreum]|uniref:AraC family transcriptional regulator n=1 Tax=Undibacterium terreum TaxID=1224302 RepID=A0A916URI0_9BURK|nr:AraC family transcriptional regulator [Undibacterium terreum]